ncbi:aldose epimerase [Amycolatopsis antarctica]|uniref:Aldose epimerase n=2 Tax=Amycolatopsis antarctica TaxID=1854586 RepID=A0A263D903_9PSEU|nr:aldose epimerase [Amycolatopsis antarctica]
MSRRGALGAAVAAGAMTAMAGIAKADPAGTTATGDGGTPETEGHGGNRRQTAVGRLYELRRGNQRAVVAGVSATLLNWQVDGKEMLLTHSPDVVGEGYQGKTIVPWPNRIEGGKYTFEGEEYQVPINEPDRGTALHGLLSFVEWQPVRHRKDSVVLEAQQHPNYGYPFHLVFRIEFSLDRNGVRSTLTARNVGSGPAPFGTANHTYIAAAAGTIDTMDLRLGASTYYLVDDNLIPTGTAPVEGTEYDFRERTPIGATVMDTAFGDLARDRDGLAVVGFTRPGGRDVELWLDSSYGYLQVYTDDDPQGHEPRSGLTVEPVSCAPNSFNTGDGLTVIAAGDEWKGTWGLRVR